MMKPADNIEFIKSYQALNGKQAYQARAQKGMLPIIEIAGHPFYVDVRIGLLRPNDDFSTMGIELNKLSVDPDTGNMVGFYDQQRKEAVVIHHEMGVPPNIVRIEIPNLYVLDPVGMARMHGKDDDKYYIQDGIRQKMYHRATIGPLQNQAKVTGKMIAAKQKAAGAKRKVTIKRKSRRI